MDTTNPSDRSAVGNKTINPNEPGVSQMRSSNSKRARANPIARNTVALDLALVQTARSLARGVAVDNRGRDVVRVDALLGNGVGDDEAALRVAGQRDLGVRAAGQGLRDELRHDGPAAGAHLRVAGDRGRVVHTLDCEAVGAEGLLEGGGEVGADGAAEVLGGVSVLHFCELVVEDWLRNLHLARSTRERRSK